ncbi:hypothetical protein MKW92_045656 [Papaver armeniacum]|nr:hypothetical protein MKW92_045656 [Papaver armeniacum]
MLVYQDLLTGDELLSDSFPYEEILDGMLWQVEGKWVVQGAVDVNIGANPSAEAVKCVDIVDTFRLQEQPTFDKKEFVACIKGFIKTLTPKLSEEEKTKFNNGIAAATKHLLSKLKDLQFFVGESMHDDVCILQGAADPTFLYFAHSLKEIEC